MPEWNYGDSYLRYPAGDVPYIFNDGSIVQVHDIFNPLPEFMMQADLIFTDPPWNEGNIKSFYTKSGLHIANSFEIFYQRLFKCIEEINPRIAYVEVGKEYLADFIIEMRKLFKNVTFYNSSYYHKKESISYVVRGGAKRKKLPLDYMDEEDIIKWVCANEEYQVIGDLCMGRGLVGLNAYCNGKRFVGTELNHKRLSVLIERIAKMETRC